MLSRLATGARGPDRSRPRVPTLALLLAGLLVLAASQADALGDTGALRAAPERLGDPRGLAGEPAFVPGEVIVGFRQGAAGAARSAARAATRTVLERRLALPRAELLRIRGERSPVRVARALERRPEVAYAQPNHYRRIGSAPNDPAFGTLWGLDNTGQVVRRQAGFAGADISALAAWEVTTGSDEVTVAVVDTGVDAEHPDLAANVTGDGADFVDPDTDPDDEHGHGTHVAGTIGALADNGVGVAGVAWDVRLMPVRVLNDEGEGTDAQIAEGFEHAADNGARIVNASFGGPGDAPVVDAAIAAAPQALFVVAAGNEGTNNDGDDPVFPCNSPEPNVICVAATSQNDVLAGFSNFGALSVDLAAPGVDINSTAAAGAEREFFFEGFELPLAEGGWVSGGANDSWDRVPSPRFSGAWSLADSPGGDYEPDTDARVESPAFDLSEASDCELSFWIDMDIPDPGDAILVEGSTDGISWSPLDPPGWTGTDSGFADHDASQLDGAPAAQIGFRMSSDADTDVGEGVHIDHVSVLCVGADHGYDFLSGTSMAAPHVAGAAALVLAEKPSLPVAGLRAAILDSVDPLPGLSGTVATGGRLNAHRALLDAENPPPSSEDPPNGDDPPAGDDPPPSDAEPAPGADDPPPATTVPRARIVRKPRRSSRRRVARFRFRARASAEQRPVRFRCRLDRRKWRRCASPRRYRVKPGRHVFRVRAIDALGNRGPPAVWRFRVRR